MNPSEYTASIDLQGLRAVVDQAETTGGSVQVVVGLNAPPVVSIRAQNVGHEYPVGVDATLTGHDSGIDSNTLTRIE